MSVTVKFNKEAAKKLSRAKFIEKHKALAEHVDLGAEYDRMFPPKKKKEEE